MRRACLLFVLGCGSDAPPPSTAPRVAVDVTCASGAKQLVITRDMKLDDSLCGTPWHALQLESPGRTEVVRTQPARELWLRRTIDRAFVEVRTPGQPTSKIDRVTAIRWIGEQAPEPDGIAIVHAGTTRHVGFQELKRQYGADSQRVSEVSLCRVADDFGNKPSKITVVGDDGTRLDLTREECLQKAAVLKFSNKGELRLRLGDGARVIRTVQTIELEA